MLRPAAIDSSDYITLRKPILGKEERLYLSVEKHTELGTLEMAGLNSGTYTASNADNVALGNAPQEVIAVLENWVRSSAAIVITVTGNDAGNAGLVGTATFAPPAYSDEQGFVFPTTWAQEVVIATGKKFKTITAVTVATAADTAGAKITLFGLPALSTFKLIICRANLKYTPKIAKPMSIACGGDDSAFVKPGQKPVGTFSVTAKIPDESSGLGRLNGVPVTGLLKVTKEDVLVSSHVFFMGLTITAEHDAPEASEPSTLVAEGLYEDVGAVLAT